MYNMTHSTSIIIHYVPGEIRAILFRLLKARNLSKVLRCHHLVTFFDILGRPQTHRQ